MTDSHAIAIETISRLLKVAQSDTGQSRHVADFLPAWHNAEANGGWDPVDIWSVADDLSADMLCVLHLIQASHRYPGGILVGMKAEVVDGGHFDYHERAADPASMRRRRGHCWFGWYRWRPLPSLIGPSLLVWHDCGRLDAEEM